MPRGATCSGAKLDSAHAEVWIWALDLSRAGEMGRVDRGQFEADDFMRINDIADADFVLNMSIRRIQRRSGARHAAPTRRRLRAARGS